MNIRWSIGVVAVLWLLCLSPAIPAQSLDELDAEGRAWLEQARTAMRSTRFDEAWSALERARQHFDAQDDVAGRIHVAIMTADYHMHTHGGALIFEAIDQALALAEQHDLPQLKAHALKQSSQYLADAGRFDQAWQRLRDAEHLYRDLEDENRLVDTQVFASLLASRAGDDARAVRLAEQALHAAEAAGKERMVVHSLSILGYSQQRLGRYEQALMTYDRLIPAAWAQGDRLQLNHAYCTVAEIRRQMGQTDLAEGDLREVIEALEHSRHQLLSSPSRRSAWLEHQVEAYSRLAALLVDDRREVEALALIDRFRSLAFFDHLAQVEISRVADPDEDWQAREAELLAELTGARAAQLASVDAQQNPARGRAESTVAGPVDLLEAQLEVLRADYWHAQAPAGMPLRPASEPLEVVREYLSGNEAMIVYWLLDERVLAWVITAEKVEFTNIPVTRAELAATVAEFVAPLRWPWLARDQFLADRENRHIESGRRLYRWLIESLPTAASQAADWVIVADDLLHNLPWAGLIRACPIEAAIEAEAAARPVHGRYAHCRWLIEDHSIRIGISPSTLVHQRRASAREPASERDSVLVVAPDFGGDRQRLLPPLPSAASEAERIASVFARPHRLAGDQATRAKFKRLATGPKVIHLATHGLVDNVMPLSSAVVLASEPGIGPGLLTAAEVLSLPLQAELVSLASCRSGAGPISRADGRQGLARAFIHAGAGQVLVSMWDLRDDHAADRLPAFFQAYRQGMDPQHALRQVQLDYLDGSEAMTLVVTKPDTALAHPRFWAGFQLIGTP